MPLIVILYSNSDQLSTIETWHFLYLLGQCQHCYTEHHWTELLSGKMDLYVFTFQFHLNHWISWNSPWLLSGFVIYSNISFSAEFWTTYDTVHTETNPHLTKQKIHFVTYWNWRSHLNIKCNVRRSTPPKTYLCIKLHCLDMTEQQDYFQLAMWDKSQLSCTRQPLQGLPQTHEHNWEQQKQSSPPGRRNVPFQHKR